MRKHKLRSRAYPSNEQVVSDKTLEQMKAKGIADRFKVVETTDNSPTPKEVEPIAKRKSNQKNAE